MIRGKVLWHSFNARSYFCLSAFLHFVRIGGLTKLFTVMNALLSHIIKRLCSCHRLTRAAISDFDFLQRIYRRIRTRIHDDGRGLIILGGDRDWKVEFDATISIRHPGDNNVQIRVRPIAMIRHDSYN